MHVINDEGESVRSNKNSNFSDFMYHKKGANTEISAYNRVLNALNKIDNSYNPTMPRTHTPVIKGKYKVNGETRVILIVVEHEEDEIWWACSTFISKLAGEPKTLKEVMKNSNGC